MTDTLPPTSDWTTDFDILDPAYVRDPATTWRELRSSCPVAHTERYGSTWLPVTYEDIAAITGTPVGTVKSRVVRAERALRPLLARFREYL